MCCLLRFQQILSESLMPHLASPLHHLWYRLATEPFQRPLCGADAEPKGMGLGLTIAQYWTKRMRGQFAISSDGHGLGTTVTAVIPLGIAHGSNPRISGLPAAPRYRIVGSSSEAVCQQLQWLGCEEWDGQPLGADAPPVLAVQDVARCSNPQYDTSTPTHFVDIGDAAQAVRPDNVEAWSYLAKPVDPLSLLALIRPETSRPQEPSADANLKVLVVDDSAINRRLLKIHFEGWTVDEADNGVQAVSMARAVGAPYHAILMDINMPIMDGYEATREIRQVRSYRHTPIWGISANAETNDGRWMECGMTAMYQKPLKWAELRQALLSAVRDEPRHSSPYPNTLVHGDSQTNLAHTGPWSEAQSASSSRHPPWVSGADCRGSFGGTVPIPRYDRSSRDSGCSAGYMQVMPGVPTRVSFDARVL